MNSAATIREWAARQLKVDLPLEFEHLVESNFRLRKLTRLQNEEYLGLILIEIAIEHRSNPSLTALDTRQIKRIIWRVLKRIQRQSRRSPHSYESMDFIGTDTDNEHVEDSTKERRLALLDAIRDRYDIRELSIISKMIEGLSPDRIQAEIGISRATYYRTLRKIVQKSSLADQ